MSSNDQSNRPPPSVKRSQPKRRKIAVLPTLLADEPLDIDIPLDIRIHRQTQRSGHSEEQTAFRVQNAPSKSTSGPSIETPVRPSVPMMHLPSGRGLSATPRMLATSARPKARPVQEQAGRLSPMVLGNLPSKSMLSSNPQVRRQSTGIRGMSIRRTPLISRSGSTAFKKITKSFPTAPLYLPDSGDSSGDDQDYTTLSKPRILWTSNRVPVVAHRAARKSKTLLPRMVASNDQHSQNDRVSPIDSDLFEGSNNEGLDSHSDRDDAKRSAQRLRDGQSSEAESEVTPEDMEKELCDVLNALTIREVKLHAKGRLPFLRRNLRRSMDALGPAKWRGHNPDAVRSPDIAKVDVVYVMLDYESPGGSFTGKWFCPLCAIKMWFRTRGALDIHIYHYHTQCDYDWVENEDNVLLLRLTVPEVPDSNTESEEDEDEHCMSEEEESSEEEQEKPTTLSMSSPREEKPFLRGPSVIKASAMPSSSLIKVQPVSPQLSSIRPGKEKKTQSPEVLRPPRPIDPIDPERYPTPPPLDNLEGPAAVYPYVTGDNYSSRPGGPKLYDLLNELSLEPFGLMSWYIIDNEEDIFELDNMRDEDKAMLAIWGRWIFPNRTKFIENHGTGIRLFIDEYWRIIHRAAGFSALRTWLLVLVQHRFLTGNQFCDALKYYIDLVGMDHWTAKHH